MAGAEEGTGKPQEEMKSDRRRWELHGRPTALASAFGNDLRLLTPGLNSCSDASVLSGGWCFAQQLGHLCPISDYLGSISGSGS